MKKNAKKQLAAAILAGLTLAVATPAMAAANPFSDVPAKHWSYDSVSKLAAAGIVDGYGDGTFRGDRTMTRYEMAQIVAKAMAHEDKANAEQKALIDQLAKEFQDELDNLGVRVGNLEKKIGNITWSGQVREWYEWRDDSDDNYGDTTNLRSRLLLFLNAPLTDSISFKGRIWAESGWGEATEYGTGADASMDQAYLVGTNGNVTWTLGRQGIQLGQGLIYAWFANNDGATLTFGGDNNTKLTLAAFKHDTTVHIPGTSLDPGFGGDYRDAHLNIVAANLSHKASKDLDLSLAYAKNRKGDIELGDLDSSLHDADIVDTWALGAVYRGINNVTLTAEYGENRSDAAKFLHWFKGEGDDSAKAWVAQAKYKGAQWDKPHSYGIWAGYREAEPGFIGVNGDYVWETPTNIHGTESIGYFMDDVKGFDYGFDYTVFKNGIFTFQYFDLEDEVTGDYDRKGFVTQLRYMF